MPSMATIEPNDDGSKYMQTEEVGIGIPKSQSLNSQLSNHIRVRGPWFCRKSQKVNSVDDIEISRPPTAGKLAF